MICHVLGLGESIKDFKEYEGYRIGVNDIYRHTYCDRVVVVNDFKKLPERKDYIDACRPLDGLWSHLKIWQFHPEYSKLSFQPWNGVFKEKTVFSGKSSPFIALTMAYSMGFKEIVLWGVDMVTHDRIKDKTKIVELNNFTTFISEIEKRGVKVFKGSEYSALKLPVWKASK